jgi:2-isopropylmalate synthase
MSTPPRVTVFDTTLRDGEQAPGFSMDVASKLAMAQSLDALGVDIIEAGFPIASPADSEAVRQIAVAVRRPVIAALARTRRQDIEEAARALTPAQRSRIHTFLATSDLHLTAKLRISRDECLQSAVDAVKLARRFTDDVEFSAEDATRSDRDFLCRVIEAVVAAGCTTVNLPDTVGYATPDETRDFFAAIIGRVPNADRAVFSAHCHNDLGLAVANSLAAIQGGVRQVECSINGIGERAGNASLEELVMALRVRQDRLPYDTGIKSEALFAASQLLSSLTSEPVQATRRSSAATRSPTKPASTRTACSRTRGPTRSCARKTSGSRSAPGWCSGAIPDAMPSSRAARLSGSRSPAPRSMRSTAR